MDGSNAGTIRVELNERMRCNQVALFEDVLDVDRLMGKLLMVLKHSLLQTCCIALEVRVIMPHVFAYILRIGFTNVAGDYRCEELNCNFLMVRHDVC